MTTALVGRSRDLNALKDVLDRTVRGPRQVAFLEGEAGIGKTHLLTDVLIEARSRGFRVFEGAAHELGRDRPFGAIADMLGLVPESADPMRADIGWLLLGGRDPGAKPPDLGQVPELRFRVLEGIISVVERSCASDLVVLCLDDAQWADSSTLLAIHELIRRLTHAPLAIVAAFRPLPRVPELERTLGLVPEATLRLELGPLDDQAVAALVHQAVDASPGPNLLKAVAGAGGNPFFITELVESLREEGVVEVAEGRADIRDVTLLPSLRLTILRRLSFLSDDSLDLLRIASVLGSVFSLSDLSLVLGRQSTELGAAIQEVLRAGVVEEAEDRLRFRHDLVREAIYADLPRSVRSAFHRQAGRALAAAGSDPLQVATQLALGASRGDEATIAWLRRAAQQAAAKAPAVAANMLQRALELTDASYPERDGLLAELALDLLWAGRVSDAQAVASEALAAGHDPSVTGILRYALGKALVFQGRVTDSLAHLEAALREPAFSERQRARLLAETSLRRLHCRDLEGAEAGARDALADGGRLGDDLAVCAALCCLASIAFFRGEVQEGVEVAAEAVSRAAGSQDAEGEIVLARMYLAWALILADRTEEAEQPLQAGLQVVEGVGSAYALPLYHVLMAFRRFCSGDWDDADAEAETSLALGEEVGSTVFGIWSNSLLAHISLHRNDLRRAEAILKGVEREFADSGLARMGMGRALWGRALLHEALGDGAMALELLSGVWELHAMLGILGECPEMGCDLVRLALSADRRGLAGSVTEGMQGFASRARTPTAEGAALRCLGLLKDDPDTLLLSVAAYRNGPRPVDRAFAMEDAAVLLARSQRIAEAAPLLEEAVGIYEHVGALRDLARAESALRGLGVRRGRRGRHVRARVGWESLTPTELQVVGLLAEGLTNREIGQRMFISPRTVETHLSHVFGKLGLSTRVQLAGEAAKRTHAQAGA